MKHRIEFVWMGRVIYSCDWLIRHRVHLWKVTHVWPGDARPHYWLQMPDGVTIGPVECRYRVDALVTKWAPAADNVTAEWDAATMRPRGQRLGFPQEQPPVVEHIGGLYREARESMLKSARREYPKLVPTNSEALKHQRVGRAKLHPVHAPGNFDAW